MGAEYNKWTTRVTARHNVALAYTRLLLGPMDYTPGGFRNVAPDQLRPAQHAADGANDARPGLGDVCGLPQPLRLRRRQPGHL